MNVDFYAEMMVLGRLQRAAAMEDSLFVQCIELQVTNLFVLLPLDRMKEHELEKLSGTHKTGTAERMSART